MASLPIEFLENMEALLGEEYENYLKSFDEERAYGLRVNTSKISTEEFEKICPFEIKKIPWIDNGYYYSGNDKPAKHPYYFAGLYYLQEPSAMTPANLLPIESGDRVLDLCAAPGGKSTELGVKLNGTGVLVSNDISNSRAKALLKNIELFGIPNSIVISESPHRLAERFTEYFDKILIDAPCSGEGMFRKEPAVIKSWLEKGPAFFAKLQREIVGEAIKMLKPGGMILYSTCTFSICEDEEIIKYLLDTFSDLSVESLKKYEGFSQGFAEKVKNGSLDLRNCVRIFPHKMKGEGHFLALLKKQERYSNSTNADNKRLGNQSLTNQTELIKFLNDIDIEFDFSRIEIRNDKVFYLPEIDSDLSKMRILRSGLLLGECKKNRFEPSQALAMALKKDQYRNVIDFDVEDERVIKYLKGETLDIGDIGTFLGYQLVCVGGYPLGFAKANGTTLKNKYLAGWRWQ